MPKTKKVKNAPANGLSGPQALNQAVWQICDVLRRSNCASALQYVPELTWILFLRVLDEQDAIEREEAEALGLSYTPSLTSPYRWQDWAAPWSDKPDAPKTSDGKSLGWKRRELQEGKRGDYFSFVNGELLPHLRELRDQPGANAKQKVISEIISPIERVRIDTESNFADVLDRVHALRLAGTDTQHQFMLSQVASESRLARRQLGDMFVGMLRAMPLGKNYMRLIPSSDHRSTAYLFLAVPRNNAKTYEEYREFRAAFLLAYCKMARLKDRIATGVVGIAFDNDKPHYKKMSEDLIYLDFSNWTSGHEAEAIALQQQLGLLRDENLQKQEGRWIE